MVWNWPNKRSRVTHAYVKGHGTYDGSMCGLPFEGSGKPSMHENDPCCKRCLVKLKVLENA